MTIRFTSPTTVLVSWPAPALGCFMLQQTGSHVDKVVISDLRDEVYFAQIFLDGGKHNLDSRPSDAIALAVRAYSSVILAEETVLEAAGVLADGSRPPSRPA